MDLLHRLKDDDKDAFIDDILKQYGRKIKDYKTELTIVGKTLAAANIEQATLGSYYDQIRVELKALLEYYDMRVKQVRGEALAIISKLSKLDHSATEKDKIIDADPKYLKYKTIYIEINEMYNALVAVCDQFKNRAYTLTNLVKLKVAEVEEILL